MLKDEMLTIEELASYLKLKPQTIYKWAQSGKIPGAKFGKEWRFRRSQIEAWIDSHMPPPATDMKASQDGVGQSESRRGPAKGTDSDGTDGARPSKRRSRQPPSAAAPELDGGPGRN